MALDPVVLNPGVGGDSIGTDQIGGVNYEVVKIAFGVVGALTLVSSADPAPVTDAALEVSAASIDTKTPSKAATATSSNVGDSASNVTILAANTNRLGATIYNDSTEILYLKLGATATTSSFSVRMLPNDYYEVPFRYVGIIDGIWANNANGSARVTELTA